MLNPDVELFRLVSSRVLAAWFSSDSVGNGAADNPGREADGQPACDSGVDELASHLSDIDAGPSDEPADVVGQG